MADFSTFLYDTIPFGVANDVTHTLFQVAQGADATHTKQFTNMRGSGQLPVNEKFVMRKLGVTAWGLVAQADLPLLFDGCFVEMRISDEIVFSSPLIYLADRNDYGGHFTQAAAADRALIGRYGMGYMLVPTITLKGGDAFRVDVFQDNLLSVAENVWFSIEGILSRG